jgi:diaminopimelate decarboxylase
LAAGGDPGKVVFSGVGKRRDELERALELGIRCFNVESEAELALLEQVAAHGVGGRRCRCASIQTWTPTPIPIFPLA